MIDVRVIPRDMIEERLEDVASLRIAVFRDWPYLYDGDAAYERQYLQSLHASRHGVIVGAFDGDWMVGAATAAPLAEHASEFAAAFQGHNIDFARTFYCAESVLLPAYRGRGIGKRFFARREEHARDLGFENICFCAVERPADHPAKASDYRPLDGLWRGRGYAPLDGVKASFAWKDVGDANETRKLLQFWMRAL